MKKKLISLCLAIPLVFSMSVPAISMDAISFATTAHDEQVLTLTSDVLGFIEPEKSMYGLSDIDFTSLWIGEEIPAYILFDDGMVLERNISYYPIMSDGVWIATSIVSFDVAGKMNVQISTEYAEVYANGIDLSEEIALLFDCDAAYIYSSNSGITQAALSPDRLTERVSIEEYSSGLAPNTTTLSSRNKLTVKTNALEDDKVSRSFDNQCYLSVPGIRQDSGSLQCWAACVASIREYYGTTTTIDDVYDFSGIPKYNGGDIYTADRALEKCGFDSIWYRDGVFNWYQLRTEIYSFGRPFFVACKYGEKTGHAVVLRGYYVYENVAQVGIISYMDPATGAYAASTVATDTNFYYVPSGSSVKYVMNGFLAVAN